MIEPKIYAIFSKATSNVPFFIDKKIGHVSLLLFDTIQYTFITANFDGFLFKITPYFYDDDLKEILKGIEKAGFVTNISHVVDCSNIRYNYNLSYKPIIFDCVEFTKYVLGIKKFFLFTPKQLYNYLKKQGSRVII